MKNQTPTTQDPTTTEHLDGRFVLVDFDDDGFNDYEPLESTPEDLFIWYRIWRFPTAREVQEIIKLSDGLYDARDVYGAFGGGEYDQLLEEYITHYFYYNDPDPNDTPVQWIISTGNDDEKLDSVTVDSCSQ